MNGERYWQGRMLFLGVLLAMALTLPAFGQTFGQISGLVSDSTGAVVPGATITVTNPQTNFTRTALSNESGYYNFPALLPGVYNVKAEIAGFQSEARNGIELEVQQAARIDFRLQVGTITETVEVSAGATLLNTENATVGTVIDNKRILDLPLNGRSFISLVALSPNVTTGYTSTGGFASIRGGSDRGLTNIAVAGLRREYTYYSLDGVSNTDVDFNTYAFLPSIDALQEFKVQTGIYSAEFGLEASQINVSTKGGTNQYHGTVFEFLRNNALDARPYAFTNQVPISAPFKWNQFGFTLGGPIQLGKVFNGKDRLFFMSNYEGFRLRNQAQFLASVPSMKMRSGDFSELLGITTVTDPLNGNRPFPGNIIPASRIHPAANKLLEFDPLPNTGSGFVNNYLELDNNSLDKDQFTQRIDFAESAKSNWFGRYSWQDELKSNAGHFTNALSVSDRVEQVMISNTRVFSPTFVNEFRTGWLGFHNINATPLAYKRDVTGELGIPTLGPVPPIGWGIPGVTIAGFTTFGDSAEGPWAADNHTLQWIDNVSLIRGSHSIKFGAEIRRDRYNNAGNKNLRGAFTFQAPTATGHPFADFLTGYLFRGGSSAGVSVSQLRRTDQAYYITDSWKVRHNLTIEAGLRYEATPAWTSRTPNFTNLIFPGLPIQPTDPRTGLYSVPLPVPLDQHPFLARDCQAYGQTDFYPPGVFVRFDPAVQTKCVHGLGTTLSPSDWMDWAPRLGMSWSPTAKTTVRAGFGIFYSQDMGNAFYDAVKNLYTQVTVDNSNHNLTYEDPFGYGNGPNPCHVSAPYTCISTPVMFLNDWGRRTPYNEQYTLNIQRELSGSTVLEIGYLGTQGHRLELHTHQDNAQPGGTAVATRVPYPEFRVLPTMSQATSAYNAGSLKLTRRLSNGLSTLFGYTYSKSIDNASGINPADQLNQRQPQTGWCVKCDRALSDFDARHRFVGSVLYELPLGKGKRFLNQGIASTVLGGWQLNSIVSRSSGFPLHVLTGSNNSRSDVNTDRPDAVPGVSWKLDNPTPGLWFNTQAFQLNPRDTFGNLGRNVVIGPPMFTWDFSTLKNFNLTEQRYLQFRFECFNCANHPVFGEPGQRLTLNQLNANGFVIPATGNFGVITTTRSGIDMRQLQFSLKLVF
jgi:Carboxypeptidase regulatory-like domain